MRTGTLEEKIERLKVLRATGREIADKAAKLHAEIRSAEREQREEEAEGDVAKLAVLSAESQARFHEAFTTYLNSFRPCPADEFWPFVGRLGSKIEYWKGGGCNPIKRAADNVFWAVLDMAGWTMEAWEQCANCAAAYDDMAAKLHRHCHEMKGVEKGDDSYGDWIDSLPLAGEPVVAGILSDDIATYKQVDAALTKHRAGLKDLIQDGENYVRMALSEVLERFFVTVVRKNGKKSEEE